MPGPFCRDCADNDGICPHSGNPCDPDDVIVKVRLSEPPHTTWRELGHLPFEVFGERFAVTRNVASLGGPLKWCVSHIATGTRVPRTGNATMQGAIREARAMLEWVGEEKFKAALAKARETIATA